MDSAAIKDVTHGINPPKYQCESRATQLRKASSAQMRARIVILPVVPSAHLSALVSSTIHASVAHVQLHLLVHAALAI